MIIRRLLGALLATAFSFSSASWAAPCLKRAAMVAANTDSEKLVKEAGAGTIVEPEVEPEANQNLEEACSGSDIESLLSETLVSAASMIGESTSTAPATSTVISADDLRRYGIRSLDQALNLLSLGMVTENMLSSVEVNARGVLLTRDYGNHVLLLVDGHMLNEPWDGTAYFEQGAAIPFELIDRIEVVLGPGSVLYGSHAMLGVINIVTKRARDYTGWHGIVESEVPNSVRGGLALGKEISLFGKRVSFISQAEYLYSKGPSLKFGPQEFGADSSVGLPKNFGGNSYGLGVWGGKSSHGLFKEIPSGFARLTIDDFQLTLRAASFKHSSPYAAGDFDSSDNFERDRWLTIDAKYTRALSSAVRISLRGYGDFYTYFQKARYASSEDCLGTGMQGCVYVLNGASRWAGIEATSSISWLDGKLHTLLGIDGRLRWTAFDDSFYNSNMDLKKGATSYRPLTGEYSLGAYISQVINVTSWFGLNIGARLDTDSAFDPHVSPRVAVTFMPWERGVLKAIYSEAFRAPSSFELYYTDMISRLRANNLELERERSVEFSFEQRFGMHRILAGVFRTWWNNLVQTVLLSDSEVNAAKSRGDLEASTTDQVFQYQNGASVHNDGINLSLDGTLIGRLQYGLNATIARARQNVGGEEKSLEAAGQIFGNARLSYDFMAPWPTVAFSARYIGKRTVAETEFSPAPSAPAQVELRLTLTGPVPRAPGASFRASVGWAFADRGPYAVGPLRYETPTYKQQELVPVNQLESSLGFQYDF